MNSSVNIIEIFLVIMFGSLLSIGGGNGPITIIQNQWVNSGILDPSLFAWVIALSYLTPGPKAGFLSGIGYYLHGIPGALAALIGAVIPTCIGAAAVSYGLERLRPAIKRISISAGFIIAGMIAETAWSTALPMHLNVWDWFGVAVVTVMVAWRNVSPVLIILGSAVFGVLLWWLSI